MLTLICGLPNSGKTTYSKRYENVIHYDAIPHITLEEHYANCHDLVASATGDICVEGVYGSAFWRKQLIATYNGEDRKVCVWINTPYEECLNRRSKPRFIVEANKRIFEPPTLDEGWDEIIEVGGA